MTTFSDRLKIKYKYVLEKKEEHLIFLLEKKQHEIEKIKQLELIKLDEKREIERKEILTAIDNNRENNGSVNEYKELLHMERKNYDEYQKNYYRTVVKYSDMYTKEVGKTYENIKKNLNPYKDSVNKILYESCNILYLK